MSQTDLYHRYQHTLARIARACWQFGRNADDVDLIAVSKRHPANIVAELVKLGQRHFGENYLQEGLGKIRQVNAILAQANVEALAEQLQWHFIGHIQSRKCREIAHHFDWVHTIDSVKTASKLNQHRNPERRLNVLIQMNLEGEAGKSGIAAAALPSLVDCVNSLDNLSLRGLMTIPAAKEEFARQRQTFSRMRELLVQCQKSSAGLDTLSMGMTDDLEAAIAEGATQVRIGTAIFGPRPD